MNPKQADAICKRISYKPNVAFKVMFYPNDLSVRLHITRTVVDAEHPKKAAEKFESIYPLSVEWLECLDEDTFVGMILAAVKRMELHEVREWFKLDGESVEEAHVGENVPTTKLPPVPGISDQIPWESLPISPISPNRWPGGDRSPTIIDRKCVS